VGLDNIVISVIGRTIQDRGQIEDLVQEALLRVLEAGITAPAYVGTIAFNVATDHLRRRKAALDHPSPKMAGTILPEAPFLLALEEFLLTLPEHWQRILHNACHHQYENIDELQTISEVSRATVFRALNLFKKFLEDYHVGNLEDARWDSNSHQGYGGRTFNQGDVYLCADCISKVGTEHLERPYGFPICRTHAGNGGETH